MIPIRTLTLFITVACSVISFTAMATSPAVKMEKFRAELNSRYAYNKEHTERAVNILKGYEVALNQFLYKRQDVQDWVKNKKCKNGDNLESSFDEIGKILGEVWACLCTGQKPEVMQYSSRDQNEKSEWTPANWNYIVMKEAVTSSFQNESSISSVLNDPRWKNQIEKNYGKDYAIKINAAIRDDRIYVNGLKLDGIIDALRSYTPTSPFPRQQPPGPHEFFGIDPFVLFPAPSVYDTSDRQTKGWWNPPPPRPPRGQRPPGPRFGPPPPPHGAPPACWKCKRVPPPPPGRHHGPPPAPPRGQPPRCTHCGAQQPPPGRHHGPPPAWNKSNYLFKSWIPVG